MDLRHITAFAAICEEGSINRAAQRLNVSQPSLSALVRDLEQRVGTELLQRLARGAQPTAMGEAFYRHCQRILAEVDSAVKTVTGAGGHVSGPIHVGLAPTIAKGLMPRLLARYLDLYPDVSVRISEAFTGQLTEWTLSGKVDFAVVAVPSTDRRLVTRRLTVEPLLLVWSPDRAVPELSGASGLKLVMPSPDHGLRTLIDRYVHSTAFPLERTVEIDSLPGMLALVRRSQWVTLLSATSVIDEVERGELCARRATPLMEVEYYLVHPVRRALSVAALQFIADLEAAFEEATARWRTRF